MNIIMNLLLGASILIVVFAGSFASRMQAVTLWLGKKIAPEGMDSEAPRGFQDAITPKIQDMFNTILPVCYIAIIVLGSFKKWYLGIALLFITFFAMVIIKRFLPNKIKFYLKIIIYYMDNRLADYIRDGDTMRAEATEDILKKLRQIYLKLMIKDKNIPEFEKINKMPLGT